jgi:hypothetical protein
MSLQKIKQMVDPIQRYLLSDRTAPSGFGLKDDKNRHMPCF